MAQVTIKEEVDLNFSGDSPESVTLPAMPFYGKVWGYVNPTAIIPPNEYLHLVKIEAGGQTKLIGPACQGWVWESNWGIENVPSGSPVIVTVYDICENGSPIDTYVQVVTPGTHFIVRFDPPGPHANVEATDVRYTSQTPPGNCPNAGGNYCDSSSWVQVPDVELVPYSGNTTNFINTTCAENPDRVAFFRCFVSYPFNLFTLSSADVIACYNQILQTWQFNLNQSVKFFYVASICSTNLTNKNIEIIGSKNAINSIPLSKCQNALLSFEGHLTYPYDIPLADYNYGFAIEEALLYHENGHRDRYKEFIDNYFFIWETEIETFRQQCTTYTDIFNAKEGGLEMYKNAMSKYYSVVMDSHDKFIGPKGSPRRTREENRVNNREHMKKIVNEYIKELKSHCNI